MHPTFEEYLAARDLTGRRDAAEFAVKRLNDSLWREIILLTAAYLTGDYTNDSVETDMEFEDSSRASEVLKDRDPEVRSSVACAGSSQGDFASELCPYLVH